MQPLCSLLDIAVAQVQGLDNDALAQVVEIAVEIEIPGIEPGEPIRPAGLAGVQVVDHFRGQRSGADHRAFFQGHPPFDEILQFADVSRPVVAAEAFQDLFVKAMDILGEFLVLALQKVLHQVLGLDVEIRCVTLSGKRTSPPSGVDSDGMVASALRDLGGEIVDIH